MASKGPFQPKAFYDSSQESPAHSLPVMKTTGHWIPAVLT